MSARRRGDRLLLALAATYFVVAAVGVYLPASAGAVAHGRVWLLFTSALEAADPWPLAQVALTAAVASLVIVRAGVRTWWCAALAGHIGSALIVYALIAAFDAPSDQVDYGVSCVLGASFGALLVQRDLLSRAVGVVGSLALIGLSTTWLGLEHPFSVVLGAVVAWRRR